MTTIADPEKKSLAVLPFKNLNNDPANGFYEFALADAVITELARIRSLVVRPSSVMSRYQGQAADPSDVGRELNVDAVLSAGFIHVGERFRVNAQLLDVKSGELSGAIGSMLRPTTSSRCRTRSRSASSTACGWN